MPKDIEDSIKQLTDARSAPYGDKRTVGELPQRGTFGRLLRLLRIGMPDWALPKSCVLLFFIGLQTYVEDVKFGNTGVR